jgi:cytochrome c-type biogenesis protein CcmF
VGPPYFGFMFVLLMAPMVILIPFGPFLKWQQGNVGAAVRALRPAAIVAVLALIAAWLLGHDLPLRAFMGLAASLWVGIGILLYALSRWKNAPAGRRYTPEMLGMILAHFGVAVFLTGVLVTEATGVEKDLRFAPNQHVEIGELSFRFDGVKREQGPNFIADSGTVVVSRNDTVIATMNPQKRQYLRGQVQTESAIDPGLTRDLYVALGEPVGDDGAWSIRVYVKPFVRWIWLGAIFMMLGGFIAATDRRFRVVTRRTEADAPLSAAPVLPAEATA